LLYRKILIPTDGNSWINDTIDFICSIQEKVNAEIYIISIVVVPRSLPLDANKPELVEPAREAIKIAEDIAAKHNVEINTSIIYSRAVEESILHAAEDYECDVIAIAHNNEKLRLFSNVSSNIYKRATCNVWLFNNKQQSE
jgi:nucleotide-binding universal stress UspA family protein